MNIKSKQIGVQIKHPKFIAFLNSVKGGQYFCIKAYVNSFGEVSDHILRWGIDYQRLKNRDLDFIRKLVTEEKSVTTYISHNVWVPTAKLPSKELFQDQSTDEDVYMDVTYEKILAGKKVTVKKDGYVNPLNIEIFSNKKAEDKTLVHLDYSLPSTHPLVISAIGADDLEGTIIQGIVNPRDSVEPKKKKVYEKEGKSFYLRKDDDGVNCWYLRDILRVSKKVIEKGAYPISTSTPLAAVKNAFRAQHMITGRYGEFKLRHGCFDSISIDGQIVTSGNTDEVVCFAISEEMIK
jgi:hypothetical protein